MYPDANHHLHICENTVNNPTDPNLYMRFRYWSSLKTPTDIPNQYRIAYFATGSINLVDGVDPLIAQAFCGDSGNEKDVFLHIDLSLPVAHEHWKPESVAPMLSIVGMDKGPDNHNGGWHLYNFGVDWPLDARLGINDNVVHDIYSLWGHFGVRGDLFRITRLAYSLMITGFLV